MKPILIFAFCLGWTTALAQPAQDFRAQVAVQRSSIIASDVELLKRRDTVHAELARLDADQRVTCPGGAQSVSCQRFLTATQARRAALVKQADFNQRHVPAGRSGNCSGCHAGPGAAPATDPIRPGMQTPGSSTGGSTSGGGTITPPATRCFIATAAWGSAWAPEVMVLRQFRDQQLLPHGVGRWLVERYYRLSPPLADWIAQRPLARAAVRAGLTPIVWSVGHPAAALGFAWSASLLLFVLWRRRRKARAT